ncbi:hypothetical protein ACS0TY_003876 [Phlomoides rotata]
MLKCSPRVKHCLWHIAHEFVPVTTKLQRFGLEVPQLCTLCAAATETVWHIVVDCPHARTCWRQMNILSTMDRLSLEVESIQDMILALLNESIWNGRSRSPDQTWVSSLSVLEEWRAVRTPISKSRLTSCCEKWKIPKADYVKVNVDASFFEHLGLTWAGIFIRDEEGEFVLGKTMTRRGLLSVDEGEAWALLQALIWISDLGFDKVEVESLNLSNALRKMAIDLSIFGDFVVASKSLLSHILSIMLVGLIEMPI